MKTIKYYFLPFLDHFLAILISLLFTLFFGSWFGNKIFGSLCGVVFTLAMCGLVYSRMWKLSRNNVRYGYGLDKSAGVRYVLPLCLLSFLVIVIYMLADHDVIPLRELVIKTYYTFPENMPREAVHITPFDYLTIGTRFWFAHLLPFGASSAGLFCISPVLTAISAAVGYKLGAENKEALEAYVKATDKVKEKFNE